MTSFQNKYVFSRLYHKVVGIFRFDYLDENVIFSLVLGPRPKIFFVCYVVR
jgi:hypothetical protein